MEKGKRQEKLHVYWATRLAHCVSQSGEVQENAQKYHDQYDGYSGGGHKEAGESDITHVYTPGLHLGPYEYFLRYTWVV